MPSIADRPTQADFALVTINHAEDQAVMETFREHGYRTERMPSERGIFAWWQMAGKKPADRYVVVHGSTGDAKGPLPAIELIRELDRLFRPRFLLILGTAGGIRERGIEYGRVIYSRQVHVGYQQLLDDLSSKGKPCKVEVRLFDDPIQPPSSRLYMQAKAAAVGWVPGKVLDDAANKAIDLLKERVPQPANTGASPAGAPLQGSWMTEVISKFHQAKSDIPEATEIFSGSYLIDGHKSELFANLKETFPKVGAVEMEAGAVAQAVLRSIDDEHFVGYLVIKGISDVVDSSVPAADRKYVRKVLSSYASLASAQFAKRVIEEWTGNTGQIYGQLSLIPPRYMAKVDRELGNRRNSNSLVYEEVTLDAYSRLLGAICANKEDITSAWKFCFLAPYRFFAAIDAAPRSSRKSREQIIEAAHEVLKRYPDKDILRSKLLDQFPHFQVFLDLAKQSNPNVVRILHKGEKWEDENGTFLQDFSHVNKGLRCYLLGDGDLDGEDWSRKDQVIINDELLFDFDEDNRRLIITSLDPEGLGKLCTSIDYLGSMH